MQLAAGVVGWVFSGKLSALVYGWEAAAHKKIDCVFSSHYFYLYYSCFLRHPRGVPPQRRSIAWGTALRKGIAGRHGVAQRDSKKGSRNG